MEPEEIKKFLSENAHYLFDYMANRMADRWVSEIRKGYLHQKMFGLSPSEEALERIHEGISTLAYQAIPPVCRQYSPKEINFTAEIKTDALPFEFKKILENEFIPTNILPPKASTSFSIGQQSDLIVYTENFSHPVQETTKVFFEKFTKQFPKLLADWKEEELLRALKPKGISAAPIGSKMFLHFVNSN